MTTCLVNAFAMTEKPNYAIMRIGKIHTRTILDAVEWHNTRRGPARVVEGLGLPDEWVDREGAYRDRADDILKEVGATHDEGKILAVEVLVAASPEWWTTATEEQMREWWRAQYAYAKHLFGPGLLAFTPHLDESTPHAQFVGLPLYHAVKKKTGPKPKDPEDLRKRLEEEANAPKIWRLSHDAVFGGGPEGLAAHQTTYHGFVAHLGLCRGRDTVGLGIKNIPLKRYAELLTQMDRDLRREAEELANERQILEHYDQQLRAGYESQRLQREAIAKDELELFARQSAFDEREQRIIAAEQEVATRREELSERENGILLRENTLAQEEEGLQRKVRSHEGATERLEARRSLLESIAQNQRSKEDNLSKREKQAKSREASVSRREAQIAEKEAVVKAQQSEVERALSQISVLTGVLSGRLAVTWNEEKQPVLKGGEPKPEEQSALSEPWPQLLASALRHAMTMSTARKRLADKLRPMVEKVRAQRKAAKAKEVAADASKTSALLQVQAAENRSAIAKSKESEANRAQEVAIEAQEKAEKDRRAADAFIAEANAVTAGLSDKRAELQQLDGAVSASKVDLTETERAIVRARSELDTVRREGASLREEKMTLAAGKAAIQSEIDDLEKRRAKLAAEQAQIDTDRANLKAEKKKWDRSMEVWQQAAASGATIDTTEQGKVVRVNAGQGEPDLDVPIEELDPTVVGLVRQRNALVEGMTETEKLATSLDERHRQLTEQFPEKKEAIEAEREKARKTVQETWARIAGTDQEH
jgi:hypothetical protein